MYIVLAYTVLKMDKGSRINYTEEQKRMLLQFFEEGMKPTKREMADKIRECSAKVGISEQQVKVKLC